MNTEKGILQLKGNIKVCGLYTLTLKNVVTGKEKTVKTHNVWCKTGWDFLLMNANWNGSKGGYHANYINAIVCGSGTGTPSDTDTALFNQIFRASTKDDSDVKIQNQQTEIIDYNSRRHIMEFVIPAKSSYVGTITEVGLNEYAYNSSKSWYQAIVTHALLQDAEGNPLSLEKTDTDQLTIRVELIVSRPANTVGLKFGFNLNKYANVKGLTTKENYAFGMLKSGSDFGHYFLSPSVNPDYSYIRKMQVDSGCSGSSGTYSISKMRFVSENSPTFYVNMIGKNNSYNYPFFGIVFPDSDIFAQRTLQGLALGTGDGSTTEFQAILPAWVKDTEKIYKNGTALTRDVDYTCDNIGNPQKDIGMTAGNFLLKVAQGYTEGRNWTYYIPGYSSDGSDMVCATKDKPIILQYYTDPLIGNSINTIIPGTWANTVKGAVITYSVSEDGTNYTDVLSITATGTSLTDTEVHSLDKDYTMMYMKISVTWPEGQSDAQTRKIYQTSSNSRFMHLGHGIVFKTAPAEGDILTMDADIDRPWKSTDYILDFSGQLTF